MKREAKKIRRRYWAVFGPRGKITDVYSGKDMSFKLCSYYQESGYTVRPVIVEWTEPGKGRKK